MIGESAVWTEMEEGMAGSVWVVTLTWGAWNSHLSRSSRIPAENPSPKALSLDSCTWSSYCELSFLIASAKSNW